MPPALMTTPWVCVRFQCWRHHGMSYRVTSISAMFVCIQRTVRRYHGCGPADDWCAATSVDTAEGRPNTRAPASAAAAAADSERNRLRVLLRVMSHRSSYRPRRTRDIPPRRRGDTETEWPGRATRGGPRGVSRTQAHNIAGRACGRETPLGPTPATGRRPATTKIRGCTLGGVVWRACVREMASLSAARSAARPLGLRVRPRVFVPPCLHFCPCPQSSSCTLCTWAIITPISGSGGLCDRIVCFSACASWRGSERCLHRNPPEPPRRKPSPLRLRIQ